MVQAAVGGGLPRTYAFVALAALALSLACAGRGDAIEGAGGAGGGDAAIDGGLDASSIPLSCRNGNKDIGETDLNCGGQCPPCALNQGCAQDADCAKGMCVLETAKCTAPASCSNGRRDGNETDTDCGGHDCAACANNRICKVNDDCASASCVSGSCA